MVAAVTNQVGAAEAQVLVQVVQAQALALAQAQAPAHAPSASAMILPIRPNTRIATLMFLYLLSGYSGGTSTRRRHSVASFLSVK